jgi:hypothetical protein
MVSDIRRHHPSGMRMESEMQQLLGRSRVMDELLEDGVNVAVTVGVGEIDMFAYVDSRTAACRIVSVPIKIASFCSDALSSNLEASRASGLLIALVWGASDPDQVRTFAFTPAELTVVKMIEIIERGGAARSGEPPNEAYSPEAALNVLEPFAMSAGKWREKISAILADKPISSA